MKLNEEVQNVCCLSRKKEALPQQDAIEKSPKKEALSPEEFLKSVAKEISVDYTGENALAITNSVQYELQCKMK